MSVTLIMAGIGALLGAGAGLSAAGDRADKAWRDAYRSEGNYEIAKNRDKSRKAILEGNLSIGAMQSTAQNREAAKAEFQKNAMSEARLGVSGTSGGTPFYKLDAEIFESERKLSEIAMAGRIQNNQNLLQAISSMGEGNMELQNAVWNLQDATMAKDYAESPFAMVMGGLTGAVSGASMGANVASMGYELNVFKEPVKKAGAAAGAVDSVSGAATDAIPNPAQTITLDPELFKFNYELPQIPGSPKASTPSFMLNKGLQPYKAPSFLSF